MTKLIPIQIRIDHADALTPFDHGFLLPDGEHAIYAADGGAFIVVVKPFAFDGLYAQAGMSTMIAHCDNGDERSMVRLYRRLKRMNAYDLLTHHFDDDANSYLV
ncbi:hypothetical protein [Cohnella mopanensis]|uniref:hypothetical protein n=1 Tax=Cohnella mopanensis TaxID=2911966 RepID=UPI001EF7DEC2|nr:hypothetical protein [Cohnella mopanensis]